MVLGEVHRAGSQNLSLDLPSVRGGKCKEFQRKTDLLCKFMCYVNGCVKQMDVLCKWMCYVNRCVM